MSAILNIAPRNSEYCPHWLLADRIAEVPTHQPTSHPPQHQSQQVPLHPLNSPAHTQTSKTHGGPKATGHKTVQGTRQELSYPSTVNTRARRGNASRLTQDTQGSPVGQGRSDSDKGRPPVSSSRNCCSTNLLPVSDPHLSPALSTSAAASTTQETPAQPQSGDYLAIPITQVSNRVVLLLLL